jgi:hypothetical protein
MSEFNFKSWEEYTPLEQAAMTYWDMYKDAYNVRPRGVDTSKWTLADFQKEFETLQFIIEREHILRKEREEQAMHEFEMRVQDLRRSGAKSREMALRWIHEAEETNGDDEYLCYTVGLPYGYFRVDSVVF